MAQKKNKAEYTKAQRAELKRKQQLRRNILITAAVIIAVVAIIVAAVLGSRDVTHTAVIEIENYGKIELALCGKTAPKTVERFVTLAESGFYDGLTFHRIMEGYMMQGGCPEGTGLGKWKENLYGEFAANGFKNDISHRRGVISMARANDYNSASCQFFIVHQDKTFWDGQYAAFGYVTDGMDVVDAVCTTAKPTDGNGTILPAQQPKILSVTVEKAWF